VQLDLGASVQPTVGVIQQPVQLGFSVGQEPAQTAFSIDQVGLPVQPTLGNDKLPVQLGLSVDQEPVQSAFDFNQVGLPVQPTVSVVQQPVQLGFSVDQEPAQTAFSIDQVGLPVQPTLGNDKLPVQLGLSVDQEPAQSAFDFNQVGLPVQPTVSVVQQPVQLGLSVGQEPAQTAFDFYQVGLPVQPTVGVVQQPVQLGLSVDQEPAQSAFDFNKVGLPVQPTVGVIQQPVQLGFSVDQEPAQSAFDFNQVGLPVQPTVGVVQQPVQLGLSVGQEPAQTAFDFNQVGLPVQPTVSVVQQPVQLGLSVDQEPVQTAFGIDQVGLPVQPTLIVDHIPVQLGLGVDQQSCDMLTLLSSVVVLLNDEQRMSVSSEVSPVSLVPVQVPNLAASGSPSIYVDSSESVATEHENTSVNSPSSMSGSNGNLESARKHSCKQTGKSAVRKIVNRRKRVSPAAKRISRRSVKSPLSGVHDDTVLKTCIRAIPDYSEDSALSQSDNEDECTQISKTARKDIRELHDPEITRSTSKVKAPRLIWNEESATRESGHFVFSEVSDDDTVVDDAMQTPFDFFKYFFTDEVFDTITEQTLLYSVQQRPDKPLRCSRGEIERFVGMAMYMSLIRMSNTRSYWSADFRVNRIADAMSVNRFEEIKKFLHFSDNTNSEGSKDKLKKIRPLLVNLRQRCTTVKMEENLSVDEQIIPFKGRSSLKQYLPMKPHKWGYKMFVLSGVSGFSYDFEFYTGKTDNELIEGESDLGASSNIVVRLCREVPVNKNHKVFFDNFFNSPALQVYLAKRGIHCLGTVRINRVPQSCMPSDKVMKMKGRGACCEKVANVDNVKLSLVSWFDNRVVNFLSNFTGSQPLGEVRRWNKKDGCYVQVPCPAIVQKYNKHMGGVDLLDSLIGLYRTKIKSKKWYLRVFFHLLDMMIVNAWLLYRKFCAGSSTRKSMRLYEFKASVAGALCAASVDENMPRKRGRPSDDAEKSVTKRRRTCSIPDDTQRTDGKNHWPKWCVQRGRCRRSGCTGTSRVTCSKCGVHLCLTPKQNCFQSFHE
jgi:hypothetical protein